MFSACTLLDASHVLKNLRNAIANSFFGGSRDMVWAQRRPVTVGGAGGSVTVDSNSEWEFFPITWTILKEAYQYSCDHYKSTNGHTLTWSSVYLDNFTKMYVTFLLPVCEVHGCKCLLFPSSGCTLYIASIASLACGWSFIN